MDQVCLMDPQFSTLLPLEEIGTDGGERVNIILVRDKPRKLVKYHVLMTKCNHASHYRELSIASGSNSWSKG